MITIPTSRGEWTIPRILELLEAHVYEDARLDWKVDVPPKNGGEGIAKTAVAMASENGGFIVIGVADSRDLRPDQRLAGVAMNRDLTQQIGEILADADPAISHQFRNPPLSLPDKPGRVIAVLEIMAGRGPHSYRGRFYGRDGSNVRQLATREVENMFIRREEVLRRARLLILELVSAREAALGINLVVYARKTGFLRSIDTRVIAELHAGILSVLGEDDELSSQLTRVRGQADVLNFRVQSILPMFYQPKIEDKSAGPNFDVFGEVSGDAYSYAQRLGTVIVRLCELVGLPPPKLLQDHEIRDRGAF